MLSAKLLRELWESIREFEKWIQGLPIAKVIDAIDPLVWGLFRELWLIIVTRFLRKRQSKM